MVSVSEVDGLFLQTLCNDAPKSRQLSIQYVDK